VERNTGLEPATSTLARLRATSPRALHSKHLQRCRGHTVEPRLKTRVFHAPELTRLGGARSIPNPDPKQRSPVPLARGGAASVASALRAPEPPLPMPPKPALRVRILTTIEEHSRKHGKRTIVEHGMTGVIDRKRHPNLSDNAGAALHELKQWTSHGGVAVRMDDSGELMYFDAGSLEPI
jgi:hypothetical protein